MWRLWTRGWLLRGWWAWVVDTFPQQIAWLLPRKVALWAFIRVYAASGESPGPEYRRAYDAWDHKEDVVRAQQRAKGRPDGD